MKEKIGKVNIQGATLGLSDKLPPKHIGKKWLKRLCVSNSTVYSMWCDNLTFELFDDFLKLCILHIIRKFFTHNPIKSVQQSLYLLLQSLIVSLRCSFRQKLQYRYPGNEVIFKWLANQVAWVVHLLPSHLPDPRLHAFCKFHQNLLLHLTKLSVHILHVPKLE